MKQVKDDASTPAMRKIGTTGSGNWILIDSSGQQVVVDVDKHVLMTRSRIHGRDLRILDPHLSYPSAILGRKRAIVLNLEHIKAIITSQEVFLRDPLDENVLPVLNDLRRRVGANSEADQKQHEESDYSPFEFRALEVALDAICTYLSSRTTELERTIYPALDILTTKVSSRNLDRVRKLKSQMTRLTARVQKVRDELDHLLDDDDDMDELYLSRKRYTASPVSGFGPALSTRVIGSMSIGSKASRTSIATLRGHRNNVEQVEKILEAYFMQLDGTLNRLSMLREYSESTEGSINIQIENHRNQLIQVELFLNTGNLCVALFALAPGLFGVNIPYSWNTAHAYLMKWVLLLIGGVCISLFLFIVSYSRLKTVRS